MKYGVIQPGHKILKESFILKKKQNDKSTIIFWYVDKDFIKIKDGL